MIFFHSSETRSYEFSTRLITMLRLRTLLVAFSALFFIAACDSPKAVESSEKAVTAASLPIIKNYFTLSKQSGNEQPQDFPYRLLTGKEGKLSDHRGKVILLNFWATWCAPCRKEMPDMEELQVLMKNENFQLLAMNMADSEEKVRRFIKKFPYSFDIVTSEQTDFVATLGVNNLPTTILIDKDGKVLGKALGPRDWKNPDFVQSLKEISKN